MVAVYTFWGEAGVGLIAGVAVPSSASGGAGNLVVDIEVGVMVGIEIAVEVDGGNW